MPKYCIVIPCFNNSDTLGEAIDSALRQEFYDYSVVVSDNNSSDETEQVLSQYNHKKLKIFKNKELLPKSENWNRAYLHADDCEYFVNLHADDLLYENCLKNIDNYASNDTSLIHGVDDQISWDGEHKKFHFPFPLKWQAIGENHKRMMIVNNNVSIVGTAFLRKSFMQLKGFSLDYNFYQDVQMWFGLSDYGLCKYIPKKFGAYRQKEGVPKEPFLKEMIKWHEDLIDSDEIGAELKSLTRNILLTKLKKVEKQLFSEELTTEIQRVFSEHREGKITNIRFNNLYQKVKHSYLKKSHD